MATDVLDKLMITECMIFPADRIASASAFLRRPPIASDHGEHLILRGSHLTKELYRPKFKHERFASHL
jgi:hypothetical protein